MKRAIATIVSVLFVVSVAGFAFATEQKGSKSELGVKPTETLSVKEMQHVAGEVTAIDAVAKTLTIKGKKGEVMLTITDKTKFANGKTLADVKAGDKLAAAYMEKGGKKMALQVMPKKEMKKEMKAKEKE